MFSARGGLQIEIWGLIAGSLRREISLASKVEEQSLDDKIGREPQLIIIIIITIIIIIIMIIIIMKRIYRLRKSRSKTQEEHDGLSYQEEKRKISC